ncbi:MAG TPA: ParB/RepB/Spo0J family partition protein [Caulobacteraceae bacterium]|nr:ParB/RepB/Spo0J family partition protein [Caulobacteraceae bacterium]
MAESRRGLGRGLSALLEEAAAATTDEARRAVGVQELPIELIRRNPDQPRRNFDPEGLRELAESIRERGLIQPILVRPLDGAASEYQIVAGERRWRAAQLAGLHQIPAIVRHLGDLEVIELAVIENVQRSDLNALEEARGYAVMVKRFNRSHEAIAGIVGKSRSHVANTLRLMRLPDRVQAHLEGGRLSAGHARALLDLDDAEALAERIIRGGLNVRQTEALARRARSGEASPPKRQAKPGGDAASLAKDLTDVLGLKVEVRARGEAGEVRIAYQSLEQLDELCARLMRPAAARRG